MSTAPQEMAEHSETNEEIPKEMECPICNGLLLYPVTTPCGHSYCLDCINQSTEYRPLCPMCRQPIPSGLSQNLVLTYLIEEKFPATVNCRKQEHIREAAQRDVENRSQRGQLVSRVRHLPLFRLPLERGPLLPGETLGLRVFEPRYLQLVQDTMMIDRRFGIIPSNYEYSSHREGHGATSAEESGLPSRREGESPTGTPGDDTAHRSRTAPTEVTHSEPIESATITTAEEPMGLCVSVEQMTQNHPSEGLVLLRVKGIFRFAVTGEPFLYHSTPSPSAGPPTINSDDINIDATDQTRPDATAGTSLTSAPSISYEVAPVTPVFDKLRATVTTTATTTTTTAAISDNHRPPSHSPEETGSSRGDGPPVPGLNHQAEVQSSDGLRRRHPITIVEPTGRVNGEGNTTTSRTTVDIRESQEGNQEQGAEDESRSEFESAVALLQRCFSHLEVQLARAGPSGRQIFNRKFTLQSMPRHPSPVDVENLSFWFASALLVPGDHAAQRWKWFRTRDTVARLAALCAIFENARSRTVIDLALSHRDSFLRFQGPLAHLVVIALLTVAFMSYFFFATGSGTLWMDEM